MADDIMAVDERMARLEVTVAAGFSEQDVRFTRLEHRFDVLERKVEALEHKVEALERKFDALERKVDGLNARVDALNGKLDVISESLEGKIQLVLERLDSRTNELQASLAMMQRESRADRRLMFAMMKDHRVRIEALEGHARSSGPSSGS